MKPLLITVLLAILLAPALAFSGDGHIRFYNYHTGETLDTIYKHKGRYDAKALKDIEHIFRSRAENAEKQIDTGLIELLDDIQDHFGADTIELISGYRSPALNSALKKHGVNVAEESMHLEGKAADIHLNEVTEEAVAEYARTLKKGGVGYYPAWDFVHIDTGDVRNWNLPDRPGRLLMAFKKGRTWQIMTYKDIYLPKDNIELQIMNITRAAKTFNDKIVLQKEKDGKWSDVKDIDACDKEKLSAGKACSADIPFDAEGFGKYRLTIRSKNDPEHLSPLSNEFYFKKM